MPDYKKRPKTAVLSTRADIRSIAAIAAFYEARDNKAHSRSHLLTMLIEDYHDLLIKNGLTTRIESTSEAMIVLSALGLGMSSMKQSGANRQNLLKQVTKESIMAERSDPASRPTEEQPVLTKKEIEIASKLLTGRGDKENETN